MVRPKKLLTGIEDEVFNLANRPPFVDYDLLRSQQRRGRCRLEGAPAGLWMLHKWNKHSEVALHRDPAAISFFMKELPRHPDWHVKGYIDPMGWCHFRKCGSDAFLPRVEQGDGNTERIHIMFHSQPIKFVYSDVPAREDIYLFLKLNLTGLLTMGMSKAGLLLRDASTSEAARLLLDWEARHPYNISRLVKRRWNVRKKSDDSAADLFRRYTYAALRGINLKWPDKQSARRADWQTVLQSVGLNFQVHETESTPNNTR